MPVHTTDVLARGGQLSRAVEQIDSVGTIENKRIRNEVFAPRLVEGAGADTTDVLNGGGKTPRATERIRSGSRGFVTEVKRIG